MFHALLYKLSQRKLTYILTHFTFVFFDISPKEFGPLQVLLSSPIGKTNDVIRLIDSPYVKFRDPEVIVPENEGYSKYYAKKHLVLRHSPKEVLGKLLAHLPRKTPLPLRKTVVDVLHEERDCVVAVFCLANLVVKKICYVSDLGIFIGFTLCTAFSGT